MIIEIQCVPVPAGTAEEPYRHVDAAIAAIAASGLPYEVSALGTTFEGPPDRCWATCRAAHDAALAAGADQVLSTVKLAEAADPTTQPTMDGLTRKHRP